MMSREGRVVAYGVCGTVKCFDVQKGFGLISRADTGEDIFARRMAISAKNPDHYDASLAVGEEVQFDVIYIPGQKSMEASNITGPRGGTVRGNYQAAQGGGGYGGGALTKFQRPVPTPVTRASSYQRKMEEIKASGAPTFSFRSLFPDVVGDGNNSLADVKLTCGEKSFHCHRVILAQKSAFFQRMFASDGFAENQSGEVKIDDISSETMEQILRFIYCGYTDPGLFDDSVLEAEHEFLYAAAKYDLAELSNLAALALEEKMSAARACDYLLLADRFSLAKLKIAAFNVLTVDANRAAAVQSAGWKQVAARADLVTELYLHEAAKRQYAPSSPFYSPTSPSFPTF